MLLQGDKGKFFLHLKQLVISYQRQPCTSSPASLAVQILVAGLKFFLGKDEDEKNESDSESEASLCDAYIRRTVLLLSCAVFVKNRSCLSDGGTISPGPEGEILDWQENQQKQEETGKGDESPQGSTAVTTLQRHDSHCYICV